MAHNNIDFLDEYVIKLMEKNPRRSFSAMFRTLRMKVPLIGDYVVMKHILRVCAEKGYKFNEGQIRLACQFARDFKESMKREKTLWVKDMLDISKKGTKGRG